MIATALLFAAASVAPAEALAPQDEAPKRREIKALLEEWRSLDPRSADGCAREQEIVARLSLVELDRRDRERWQDDLDDEQEDDGRTIAKDSGRHWFWEEERRGLYLVGGDTRRPEGLLVGLHGGGAGSGDAGGIHPEIARVAEELDLLAISPEVLEKTEHGWTDSGTEEFVLDLVDAAIRTWEIDPARVYFAGHSMGGYGSWTLGAHHADRVAGLAPSAGAPTPVMNYDHEIIDIDTGVVPNLRNVPMIVYQSVDDPRVPPDVNQFAAKRVARARAQWGGYEDFRYLEVDGRGHDYPDGGLLTIVEPLMQFTRQPVPERIVWQPKLPWKRQFYWLWWQEPALEAILVADLDREANAVRIQCDQPLSGLRILLDERVLDLEREVRVFVNGTELVAGAARPNLGDLLRTHRAPDPALRFVAGLDVPEVAAPGPTREATTPGGN